MKHPLSPSRQNPVQDTSHLKRSFMIVASFTAFLWLIKIIESVTGTSFAQYGVYPGQLSGLTGILWAPLIHGSFTHLLANTLPLIILGTALLYGYPKSARIVIPSVYVGTGLGVWLFARAAFHVGASGLTFGFMFFVFTVGALRWDRRAIALAMVVFFLYGGMILGILPNQPGISFESHFFGAMIGLVLAIVLRNNDPRVPQKRYDWEEDEIADPSLDSEADDNTSGR
ncbi:MAG: rhomboid family intramembrane serine protease [Gammaproteobacteria bacterium]